MSPSRRRAIGAVRGFASRARSPTPRALAVRPHRRTASPVAARHRGAWICPPPRPLTCPVVRTLITRAARWGHRALPPLLPQNSHTTSPPPRALAAPPCRLALYDAKNLCVPIHPVPLLFVLLCVQNFPPHPRTPAPSPCALAAAPLPVAARHRRARRLSPQTSHLIPHPTPTKTELVLLPFCGRINRAHPLLPLPCSYSP